VIDGRASRQEQIGNGAPVLVLAERLARDTTMTERIDLTESLRMNGIVDMDPPCGTIGKYKKKWGPPN